jgi:hypothetical protein
MLLGVLEVGTVLLLIRSEFVKSLSNSLTVLVMASVLEFAVWAYAGPHHTAMAMTTINLAFIRMCPDHIIHAQSDQS